MADFERQVEELSGRVSSLMEEKRSLESRNSLLERVVQLKQETGTETVRRRRPQEPRVAPTRRCWRSQCSRQLGVRVCCLAASV